jgi:hypothetical protein
MTKPFLMLCLALTDPFAKFDRRSRDSDRQLCLRTELALTLRLRLQWQMYSLIG